MARTNAFVSSLLLMSLMSLVGCARDPGLDPVADPPPVTDEQPQPPPPTTPAALALSVSASPVMVSVGQELLLEVTVRNTGEATAVGVVPTTPKQSGSGLALVTSAPNPVDLEGGRSHRFTFVYSATDPGPLTFEVGATGMDPEHDRDVVAPPQSASVIIQSAAMLGLEVLEAPAGASVGTEFTVRMVVTNGGQSPARNVTPDVLTLQGAGAATLVSGPVPESADLPQGGSTTFTWTFRASGRGPMTFSGGARGVDGNSGEPVSADPLTSSPVALETPAALDVALSVPPNLTRGQNFTATMVVRNTGGAIARGVLPNPLLPASTTVSGNAVAATSSPPAPVDIPGGGLAAFTWTYALSGTGALNLVASARGTDAITGQPVESRVTTSNTATVLAPSVLTITSLSAPGLVARGQPFDVVMVVRNTGTVALTSVVPAPAPPAATSTGGARAQTVSAPAPQDLAAGASATFTWRFTENGTAPGSLSFSAGARGLSGTTVVTANTLSSNLSVVVDAPALLVDSITVPARISRGQTFDAVVVVRNTGGSLVSNVLPALTIESPGPAAARVVDPAPQNLGGGMTGTFVFRLTENGSGPGVLQATVVASGLDVATAQTITSVPVSSRDVTVQTPAELSISTFTVPATITRGTGFAVSMTVRNLGQAAARNVVPLPAPPTAAVTGGVVVSTPTAVTPVTIPGNGSQTFTWMYSETGTGPGTVAFSAGVQGLDANSGQTVAVQPRSSSSAAVATPTGCNGSALYSGFGGRSLDGDRLDQQVGRNRLRVKPYPMLVSEYARVLGMTPSAIQGQGATFNQPGPRWAIEPELSAVSMNQAFRAAFQGCLTFTATAPEYAANPTAATANTQCASLERRFWSRVPTAAETAACANFATSAVNNDTNPRRRWAYVCAAVLTSTGFLTH